MTSRILSKRYRAPRIELVIDGSPSLASAPSGRLNAQRTYASRVNRLLRPSDRSVLVWLVVFLGLPSLSSVEKFTGVVGLVLYVLALPVGIAVVRSWLWTPRLGRDIALLAALAAVLVVGLLVLYPLADSGRVGGGSDNDEALNLATRALVRGDDPYARETYLGNPVAVLPGALVLSAPFAPFGNIAVWANAFWLGALVLVLWRMGKGADASASTLALGLFLCVAGLNAWIVGSDRLANTICVLLLSIGVCALASFSDRGSFPLAGSALVLGIGLSWRINFVLIVPPLLAFVAARRGWRAAVVTGVALGAGFVLVTMPFLLADPGGFAPFHTLGKASTSSDPILARALIVAATTSFSLLVAFVMMQREPSLPSFLWACALVLATPVWLLFPVVWITDGWEGAFGFATYGLFAAIFASAAVALRGAVIGGQPLMPSHAAA